ncbi:hypothetical protein Gpo141_00003367 [Globisporangium polare]
MASKAVPPPHQTDQERAGWWDESASPAGYTGHHQPQPRVDYHQQPQPQHNPYQYHDNNANYYAVDDDDRRNRTGLGDRIAIIVLAIVLPPLGVFFQTGCNKDLAINVLLTLLGYLPGIIHALYIICIEY